MQHPNFFIVGAPKCGTSALYAYLRTHPQIFMSRVKEPHHFCADFPGLRRFPEREQYLELFRGAEPHHRVRGEASTHYLRSQVALPEIRRSYPEARLVVMLRHPTELAHSLHAQLLYDMAEDEPDFATAWRLQAARRRGSSLPAGTKEPTECLYGQVAALGSQVERALECFPRQQVMLIFSDDFFADPGACYRRLLNFLQLPQDDRQEFPRVNPTTTYRCPALARFLIQPPFPFNHVKRGLKQCFGWTETGLGKWIYGRLTVPTQRHEMSPSLRAELNAFFAAEVRRLERVTGRDLSPWLDGSPQRSAPAA